MTRHRSGDCSGKRHRLSQRKYYCFRQRFRPDETAAVRLVVPAGWTVTPPVREAELGPHGEAELEFRVVATGAGRVAADLTVGETRFGQQAEALVEQP